MNTPNARRRAPGETAYRGGLPIHLLRKVEDYVAEHLAEEISIEGLAELVKLSASHFDSLVRDPGKPTSPPWPFP